MTIIRRDSETWLGTAGRDELMVLGDELTVAGDEAETAATFIILFVGSPIQQLLYAVIASGSIARRVVLIATAERVG